MRFTSAVLLCAVFSVGCQHSQPGRTAGGGNSKKKAQNPAANKSWVTPVIGAQGKVAAVNANSRFVVIDFGLAQLPQVGQRLNVYRQGLKVGEVKISGPARDTNIAADITAGEAQVGDEIRSD